MSLPRFQDGQEPLINKMLATGHSRDDGGVCHGVAYKGMFAILGETLDEFDNLLAFVYEELPTQPISLNGLRQILRREQSLFDGIKLFQNPQEHSEVFPPQDHGLNQCATPDQLIPLLTPIALEEQGGVTKLIDATGASSVTELQHYFDELKQIIDKQQIQDPIAFVMSSSKHSITVGYQPKSGTWVVINANTLPSEIVESEDVGRIAAKRLLSSSQHVSCRMVGYTKKQNEAAYTACLKAWLKTKAWRTMHLPNSKTCNIANDFNTTWLHTAASEGNLKQVAALIRAGAKLNARDDDGWTPLKAACSNGHTDVARILLEHGADPTIRDNKHGWPAFMNAAIEGNTAIMQLLAQRDPKCIDFQDARGFTALFAAAQIGSVAAVKYLINMRANPLLCFRQTAADFIDFGKEEQREDEMMQFIKSQQQSHIHAYEVKATTGTLLWSLSNTRNKSHPPGHDIHYNMSPKNIAKILGHDEIYDLLDTYERHSKFTMV